MHEADEVMEFYQAQLGMKIIKVDASQRFFEPAEGDFGAGREAKDHRGRVYAGLRGGSR